MTKKEFIPNLEKLFNNPYSNKELTKHIIKKSIETPIGRMKRRPLKHYKRYDKLFKVYSKNPIFTYCLLLKCDNLSNCWDIGKGILKEESNKFKPLVCFNEKLEEFRRIERLRLIEAESSPKLANISNYERSIIIAGLKLVNNGAKSKEIIRKIADSDILKLR